jgi:hypothetical protein
MSELRAELRQARSDLRRTSLEFKRRLELETYESRVQEHVGRRPMRSVMLAAGLGFMVGCASRHTAVLVSFLGGMAVGYGIAGSASGRTHRLTGQ